MPAYVKLKRISAERRLAARVDAAKAKLTRAQAKLADAENAVDKAMNDLREAQNDLRFEQEYSASLSHDKVA